MSTDDGLKKYTAPSYYSRMSPQPWDVMLMFKLNAVQAFALKYLARVGEKEGTPAIIDYAKAIECLEKLIAVNPPPEDEEDPPWRLEALPEDDMLGLPAALVGWILPVPILIILRWLFDAWIKKSTIHHRAAIKEIRILMEAENAVG